MRHGEIEVAIQVIVAERRGGAGWLQDRGKVDASPLCDFSEGAVAVVPVEAVMTGHGDGQIVRA